MNHFRKIFVKLFFSVLISLSILIYNRINIFADNGESSNSIIQVEKITLNNTSLLLDVGKSKEIIATVLPENATEKTVQWKSDNPEIATVNNGVVNAVAAGTTIVTATSGTVSEKCTVTVNNPIIAANKLSLNKTSLILNTGSSDELKATVEPENVTNKTVVWTSNNPTVASVNNGEITAISIGNASITATSGDISATCTVTVNNPVINVNEVSLNKLTMMLEVGEQETLSVSVLPENATDKTIIWTSSNPMVVSVKNGQITAVSAGTAIVTASAAGYSSSCVVTTVVKAEGFIYRLYRTVLKREPDITGLKTWISQLNAGASGSSVAYDFFFSDEFKNKNYCDAHYVKYLYETLMDREPDTSGYNNWINALYHGTSRESVINGFLLSPEFARICTSNGINRGNGITVSGAGTVQTQPCSVDGSLDTGMGQFVARLYEKCLGRTYDNGGLKTWISQLNAGASGSSVAYKFLFSPEFKCLNTNNEQYVISLYNTLFNRNPDTGGKNNWVNVLNSGSSRYSVFQGFISSTEWKVVCANFGVKWELAYYESSTPVFYSQQDPSWAYAMFGSFTVGKSGCGPTTMAMIIQPKIGRVVTPFDVAAYLHSIGKYNNGSLVGSNGSSFVEAGKRYGLSCDYVDSYEKLVSLLEEGKSIAWQVVGLPFISPQYSHAIVLYGYNNGNVNVLDPNSGKCNGVYSAIDLWNHRSNVPSDLDLGVPGFAF